MAVWIVVIAVALVLSLGYRALRYRAIRREGHDVQWEVPLIRWIKRRRDDEPSARMEDGRRVLVQAAYIALAPLLLTVAFLWSEGRPPWALIALAAAIGFLAAPKGRA